MLNDGYIVMQILAQTRPISWYPLERLLSNRGIVLNQRLSDILNDLELQKLVDVTFENNQKYYTLNAKGRLYINNTIDAKTLAYHDSTLRAITWDETKNQLDLTIETNFAQYLDSQADDIRPIRLTFYGVSNMNADPEIPVIDDCRAKPESRFGDILDLDWYEEPLAHVVINYELVDIPQKIQDFYTLQFNYTSITCQLIESAE